MPKHTTPVITIDGPAASGKGTMAKLLAQRLGFNYFDSGAIYRLSAFIALQQHCSLDDEAALIELIANNTIAFIGEDVFVNAKNVSSDIRSDAVAEAASQIAQLGKFRLALLNLQREQQQMPGLVADGRDMGTVVFPHATLKIYLTASQTVRAQRRYTQLLAQHSSNPDQPLPTLQEVLHVLVKRDERDSQRQTAALKPAIDALVIDNSTHTFEQTLEIIHAHWLKRSAEIKSEPFRLV